MSKRGGKRGKELPPSDEGFSTSAFAGLAGLAGTVPAGAPEVAANVEQNEFAKGARFPNKLVVRMEKKGRGGKTITRVSGVPEGELAPLCKEMKKALGCGATLEGEDLVLLGDLVPRAVAWLEAAGANRVVRGT